MSMSPIDPDTPPIPEKTPPEEPTRDPRIPDPRIPPNPPGTPPEMPPANPDYPSPGKIRANNK